MKILLDCERMKYPHTGLYHYCLQLGKALQQEAKTDELYFYAPPSAKNAFGNAQYIWQHSYDKFSLPVVKHLDVWHCTFQGSSYFPFRKKVRKVFTVHDLNFMRDEQVSASRKKKYLSLLAKKVSRSDHITAVSKYAMDELVHFVGLQGKPATVVYNGCNVDDTPALAPKYLPPRPFLFTIGTILEKKNMHVLPALLARNDFLLVIAGITINEDYKQRIVKEAAKYQVRDRVIFTGPVSENDKKWYLQQCTAFLLPSLAEGFGLPVVEAMHYGKPVFLSDLTSLPEIGGSAAYYFPGFDPGQMQEVFEKGMHHYRTNHPEKAIRERAAMFNWNTAAKQYLDVYHAY